jgi:hypothetical protein
MICPQCKSEYRAGFTRCSDCNVDLVDQLPTEVARPIDHHRLDLVLADSYSNQVEADVARTALEGSGIETFTSGDDLGGEAPYIAFNRGIEIFVRRDDVEAAKAVLSADVSELADRTEAAQGDGPE